MKDLFKKEPELLINIISEYYPFNSVSLKKVEDKVNWILISENQNISQSIDFVKNFENRRCFDLLDFSNHQDYQRPGLSSNPKINIDILEKLYSKFNWEMLSRHFNFSNLAIDKILEKKSFLWNWKYLSTNITLPWNENFIERYKERINWVKLSSNSKINWSESFIEKYKDKLNWSKLSFNKHLPWSSFFLKKYRKQINIKNLSWNSGFSWNEELIEKYQDNINWEYLSNNIGVEWSGDLIEKFGIENVSVFNIDRFENKKFHCYELSKNPSLPWNDINFFLKFIHFYILDCDFSGLIQNKGINWCEKKINICKMKWEDFPIDAVVFPNKNLNNINFYIDKRNKEFINDEFNKIIWNIISPLINDDEIKLLLY